MIGFLDGIFESILKFYFESEEKSGGGIVICIKVNYSDCICFVYFGECIGDYKYEIYFYYIFVFL